MEQTETNELDIIQLSEDSHLEVTPANPHSRSAMSAFVCGILAVSLNLFAITAFVGLILSILSIVFGATSFEKSSYGKAGLVLGFLSLFIIMAYVLSAITIKVADPFL